MTLNIPINNVSFGSVSMGVLKELHRRGTDVSIFPIGNVEPSFHELSKEFVDWLKNGIHKSLRKHKREHPVFKLWHINGSLESVSNQQYLFTFYELDNPTDVEINILNNQTKTLVSNKFTKNVFEFSGVKNVEVLPLYFDADNFNVKDKVYFNDGRITFNVLGKFERRKNHELVIKTWLKTFGNNPKYFLQCAIYNPFLSEEDNKRVVHHLTGGQKFFNANFLGLMGKNAMYNDFLNSSNIVIALGNEGWGLPEFHSVALGKHALVLDCGGYKEWATKENSVLITPNQKIEAYDNMFFSKGTNFNQGNIFTTDEKTLVKGFYDVVERYKSSPINKAGLQLQNQFTVSQTTDKIISLFS